MIRPKQFPIRSRSVWVEAIHSVMSIGWPSPCEDGVTSKGGVVTATLMPRPGTFR